MKRFLCSLFVIALIPCSVLAKGKGLTAEQERSLEIGGVRIGMTVEESIEALMKKYNIPRESIMPGGTLGPDEMTKKKEVYSLTLTFDGQKVEVLFSTDISTTPYKRVASTVFYTMPYTPENCKNLEDSIVKKYGEDNSSITELGKSWNITKGDIRNSTKLSMSPAGCDLKIQTYRYNNAIIEFKQKQENRRPNY